MRSVVKLGVTVSVVVCLSALWAQSQTANVYVDARLGTDTPTCGTAGAPCKTIGYAVSKTSAPAVVYVRGRVDAGGNLLIHDGFDDPASSLDPRETFPIEMKPGVSIKRDPNTYDMYNGEPAPVIVSGYISSTSPRYAQYTGLLSFTTSSFDSGTVVEGIRVYEGFPGILIDPQSQLTVSPFINDVKFNRCGPAVLMTTRSTSLYTATVSPVISGCSFTQKQWSVRSGSVAGYVIGDWDHVRMDSESTGGGNMLPTILNCNFYGSDANVQMRAAVAVQSFTPGEISPTIMSTNIIGNGFTQNPQLAYGVRVTALNLGKSDFVVRNSRVAYCTTDGIYMRADYRYKPPKESSPLIESVTIDHNGSSGLPERHGTGISMVAFDWARISPTIKSCPAISFNAESGVRLEAFYSSPSQPYEPQNCRILPDIESSTISENGGNGIDIRSTGGYIRGPIKGCVMNLNGQDGVFNQLEPNVTTTQVSACIPELTNCVIGYSGRHGIYNYLYPTSNPNATASPRVLHTTISSSAQYGIENKMASGVYDQRILVKSSIVYWSHGSGPGYDVRNIPAGNITFSNFRGPGAGSYKNQTGDPKFVNPSNLDFHLQTTSPCIDAGTIVQSVELPPMPPVDYDGETRVVDYKPGPSYRDPDQGADEVQKGV